MPATSIVLFSFALGAPAAASPKPGILSDAARNPAPLLLSTDPRAARFSAVGKLLMGDGAYHCTGSVVAASDSPPPSSHALILTAGHCVEESDENAVIIDRPAKPSWSFTPAYFIDTQSKHVTFGIERVLHSTMKNADIAVLSLKATYGELAALGVRPLRLQPTGMAPGAPVELAHIPVIGVAEEARFLRHSTCRAQARQTIFEDPNPWYWPAALPNDCQGVAGGTSGSPVFAMDGGGVIAVLNTTVSPGYVGCGGGRPCELTDGGLPVAREDTSYAMPVERIAQAIRDDGTIDVTRLDPGSGVTLSRTRAGWITQRNELIDGERVPARWNLRIEEGFDLVRYKTGPATTTNCADNAGYSEARPYSDQPLVGLALPAQEGVHVACVIGGTTGGIWQAPRDATIRLRQIDDTAPAVVPYLDSREHDGLTEVKPDFVLWELRSLFVKFGPASQTDCQAPDGYQPHRWSRWYAVDKKQPWRFCAYGNDIADNQGPTATFNFEEKKP